MTARRLEGCDDPPFNTHSPEILEDLDLRSQRAQELWDTQRPLGWTARRDAALTARLLGPDNIEPLAALPAPTRWNGSGNIGEASAPANLSTQLPLTLRQSAVFSGAGPGWTKRLFLPKEESTPARPPPTQNMGSSSLPSDLQEDLSPNVIKPTNISARSVAFRLEGDMENDAESTRNQLNSGNRSTRVQSLPVSEQKASSSKGKGIDLREWGNLDIDDRELNPQAQYEQYEYLRQFHARSSANNTLHLLSSEPSTPEADRGGEQTSGVSDATTDVSLLSSPIEHAPSAPSSPILRNEPTYISPQHPQQFPPYPFEHIQASTDGHRRKSSRINTVTLASREHEASQHLATEEGRAQDVDRTEVHWNQQLSPSTVPENLPGNGLETIRTTVPMSHPQLPQLPAVGSHAHNARRSMPGALSEESTPSSKHKIITGDQGHPNLQDHTRSPERSSYDNTQRLAPEPLDDEPVIHGANDERNSANIDVTPSHDEAHSHINIQATSTVPILHSLHPEQPLAPGSYNNTAHHTRRAGPASHGEENLSRHQINMDFLPQEGVTFPDENTTAAAPPYTPHPEHLTQAAVEPLSRATVRPEDTDLSRAILASLSVDPQDVDLSRAILESLNLEAQPSGSGTQDDQFLIPAAYLHEPTIEHSISIQQTQFTIQNQPSRFLSEPPVGTSTYGARPISTIGEITTSSSHGPQARSRRDEPLQNRNGIQPFRHQSLPPPDMRQTAAGQARVPPALRELHGLFDANGPVDTSTISGAHNVPDAFIEETQEEVRFRTAIRRFQHMKVHGMKTIWTLSGWEGDLGAFDIEGASPGNVHFHRNYSTGHVRIFLNLAPRRWQDCTNSWLTYAGNVHPIHHPTNNTLILDSYGDSWIPSYIKITTYARRRRNDGGLAGFNASL